MINVPMDEERPGYGPGGGAWSAEDAAIKGIWCVPKFSNPHRCSPTATRAVRRFARLKPAAPDFRIFWDNAYGVHGTHTTMTIEITRSSILAECAKRAGNPDLVYEFCLHLQGLLPGRRRVRLHCGQPWPTWMDSSSAS